MYTGMTESCVKVSCKEQERLFLFNRLHLTDWARVGP